MKITPRFKARRFFLTAAFLAGLGMNTQALAQQRTAYLIDLNTRTATNLGNVFASAINDAGQVVGSYAAVGGEHAFLSGPDGVGKTDLGTLGGSSSRAFGINAAGQVVGESDTFGGAMHAFITGPDGMSMRDLGTLDGISSQARAINDAGQVAGSFVERGGDSPYYFIGHAFITGPDGRDIRTISKTHPPFAWAEPQDMNSAGQVVGFSGDPPLRSFITGPNGEGMRDIDASLSLNAYGINDAGQVVGLDMRTGNAFITGPDGEGIIQLGTLGGNFSIASGINEAGQVVGESGTADGSHRAFITGPGGVGMTDLNSLVDLPEGHTLTRAVAINNAGQVLVTGTIPEPESYALFLAGLALTGFMARRKKVPSPAGHC